MNGALLGLLRDLSVLEEVDCTPGLVFSYRGSVIAEADASGESVTLDVRCHPLDAPALLEEYGCCSAPGTLESGLVRFELLSPASEEEKSALLEAFRSAMDLAGERVGSPGSCAGEGASGQHIHLMKGEMYMARMMCLVCGWVYDPEIGDPDGGIAPGTPWESLPDDWVCPVCGASKSDFKPE